MAILVCGGAGYIGSHTVKELVGTYEVVVLDNLTTGFEHLVDERATFVKGDLGDQAVLDKLFTTYSIDAVFHFAANSLVGESVENPLKYYKNNVSATLVLLEKMVEHGVKRFIFSSTPRLRHSGYRNDYGKNGNQSDQSLWAIETDGRADSG